MSPYGITKPQLIKNYIRINSSIDNYSALFQQPANISTNDYPVDTCKHQLSLDENCADPAFVWMIASVSVFRFTYRKTSNIRQSY